MKIVLYGADIHNVELAIDLKKANKTNEVTIISSEQYIGYDKNMLVGYIGGFYTLESIQIYSIDKLRELNIRTIINQEILEIDHKNKNIRLIEKTTKHLSTAYYDYLVIGEQKKETNKKVELNNGIFTLNSLEDAINIKKYMYENNPKTCLIEGTNNRHIELAGAFFKMSIQTKMIAYDNQILENADIELEREIRNIFDNNIEVEYIDKILNIKHKSNIDINTLRSKNKVDMLILDTQNAKINFQNDREIKKGKNNTYYVNENMEVLPDLFMYGDGINTSIFLNKEISTNRFKDIQKNIIFNKIQNDYEIPEYYKYNYLINSNPLIINVLDYTYASCGINEKIAQDSKIKYIKEDILRKVRRIDDKNVSEMYVKLIIEASTLQILGAEILGKFDVNKKIDVLSSYVSLSGNIYQLAMQEFSHSPRYNHDKDILNEIALKIIKTRGEND